MSNVIKSDRVRLMAPQEGEPEPAPVACVKAVRLLRLDGDVRAVEVTCSCGERTLIELNYQAEGQQP